MSASGSRLTTHSSNSATAILFPTVPPSTAPERTSSLGPRNLSPKQSRAISPSNPRSLTHRRIHSSPAPLPPPPADESGPTQLLRSFILRTGGRHESNLSLDELELARLSKERATLGPTCKAERTKHAALLEACAAQGAVEDVTPVPGWDAESEAGSSESDGSDEDGVDVLVDVSGLRNGIHGLYWRGSFADCFTPAFHRRSSSSHQPGRPRSSPSFCPTLLPSQSSTCPSSRGLSLLRPVPHHPHPHPQLSRSRCRAPS